MTDELAPRGPDGSGVWASGPVAFGHRRLAIIDLSSAGRAADGRLRARPHGRLQRLHLQPPPAAPGARAPRGTASSPTSDTEVILKAYHRWGEDFVDHLIGHVRASRSTSATRARVVLARDRLGIKPLYLAEVDPARCASPRRSPALVAGGDVDTSIDPVGAAPLPDVPRGRARAAHDPRRACTKLPPATVLVVEPDGAPARAPLLVGRSATRRSRARTVARPTSGCS